MAKPQKCASKQYTQNEKEKQEKKSGSSNNYIVALMVLNKLPASLHP